MNYVSYYKMDYSRLIHLPIYLLLSVAFLDNLIKLQKTGEGTTDEILKKKDDA